jgi:hypothetical protein
MARNPKNSYVMMFTRLTSTPDTRECDRQSASRAMFGSKKYNNATLSARKWTGLGAFVSLEVSGSNSLTSLVPRLQAKFLHIQYGSS